MSFFGDWGEALSRPFKRTAQGFKKVFTNPGKANVGDFVSVALPGWGGTIVNDIQHPQDVGFQAATLAAVAGGVTAYDPSTAAWLSKAQPAQATLFDASGRAVGDLTPRAVPALRLSATPGDFVAAGWRAPTAAELAAQRGLEVASAPAKTTLGTALKETSAAVKNVVMGTATLSTAARQIAQPWERAVQSIKESVSGDGSRISVEAGGSGGPGAAAPAVDTEAAPAPQLAGADKLLLFGVLLPMAAWAAWSWYRGRRK